MLQRLQAQPRQKLLAGFETTGGGPLSRERMYPEARPRAPGAGAAVAHPMAHPSDAPMTDASLASGQPNVQQRMEQLQQVTEPPPRAAAGHAPEGGRLQRLPGAPSADSGRPPGGGQSALSAAEQAALDAEPSMSGLPDHATPAESPLRSLKAAAVMPSQQPAAGANARAGLLSRQASEQLELSLQLPPDPEEMDAAVPSPAADQQRMAAQPETAQTFAELQAQAQLQQQPEVPPPQQQQQQQRRPVADDMALAQQVSLCSSAFAVIQRVYCRGCVCPPRLRDHRHVPGTFSTRAEPRVLSTRQVAAQKRAACDVLKGAPCSSRDDPEFMNTFFKASRLHFIGTWKVRRSMHCTLL